MLTDSPFVDFLKRVVVPILIVVGILVAGVIAINASTCNHDQNTVEFWEEEYKQIPAETIRIEGNEVTVAIKDKYRQKVYVLHTDKEKPEKGKWYMFGFCQKCLYLFGFRPL